MAFEAAAKRIIWSADVPNVRQVRHYVDQMGAKLIKVDRLFMETRGPVIIDDIQQRFGVWVFDDAKFIEIPSKLEALAKTHLKYRPWMLNCMAGGVSSKELDNPELRDGLKRFADACHAVETLPCGVTVLTSKSEEVIHEEFGRSAIEQVLYYVDVLAQMGFTDVVCSPLEAQAIRAESAFDHLSLNTPGVRFVGSARGDQARVATPRDAIRMGATRVVMGRPLMERPSRSFQRALLEVDLALAT